MSNNRTKLPGNRIIGGNLAVQEDATIVGDITAASVSTTTGVQAMQFTAAYTAFTDGGGAAGTYTYTSSIPKGAVVTRTMITAVTGFAGDTSATVTIGDGTDVDRYNTGTPNVFATATDIDAGAVSGTAYHSAAKAPVVTITSGADWGSVTAGSITVTIFYYEA